MAKFLLRCAEDVDIFHAAAVIAGSVMRIALEMLLMIRAFGQTHASRYNNLCIISDAVCTISPAWLQSLNVIIDDFTLVFQQPRVEHLKARDNTSNSTTVSTQTLSQEPL